MDDQLPFPVRLARAGDQHTVVDTARHPSRLGLWLSVAAVVVLALATGRSVAVNPIHPDQSGVFTTVPIERFVGLRFAFLEKPASLQVYGYQSVRRTREPQYSGDYRVSYQEAVGRVGRVVAVEAERSIHLIRIQMDDDGQTYYVEAYSR